MSKHHLKIAKFIPTTPLEKIYDERLIDWIEDGMAINHQREKHREKYRTKICANCTSEQKEKRECIIVDCELDKRSCGHMERAVVQKFTEKAKIHSDSHPLKLRRNNPHVGKSQRLFL